MPYLKTHRYLDLATSQITHKGLICFTDLLAEKAFVSDFLHLVNLGFEEIDVFFFIYKEALEQVA